MLSNEHPRLIVVGGILWRGNTFLAAQRPKKDSQGGMWEFPGGKVEPGESLEEALSRELIEELSLIAHNPVYWDCVDYDYPNISVRLHCFNITDFSGDPTPNEGQCFRWVTPDEACALPFLEADRPLLRKLGRCP